MASHPYISGAGNIAQMIAQLRKSFPPKVDSNTVKRLGLAPNNESFVINALQFVDVIDEEGKKTTAATTAFSSHKDEDFAKHFAKLIQSAYSALFELHGDNAWELSKDDLITFFRQTDDTGAVIGGRQASTFQVFAALSGHGEVPAKKESSKSTSKTTKKKATIAKSQKSPVQETSTAGTTVIQKRSDFGLTVRIEINLPSDGSKDTYDSIFKSIKENLIDG